MRPAGVLPDDRRDWLRHLLSGNPWSYQAGDREVEIAPLVSPLRYDITVRASFLRFFREHRDLYRSDFERFGELASHHDYFVWFRYVMCVNWQPHVLRDDRLFSQAWATRLRSVAALVESFERSGFDTRFPVTLYSGRQVLETGTGKRLARELYAGDGNHRIAVLLDAGERTLLPGQYRLKRFRRLQPIDTTPELLNLLKVGKDAYFRFLGEGYPTMQVDGGGDRSEVGAADSAVAAEIRSVLRIDGPNLRQRVSP